MLERIDTYSKDEYTWDPSMTLQENTIIPDNDL